MCLEKEGLNFVIPSDTYEELCTYPVLMARLRGPGPLPGEGLDCLQGAFLRLPLLLTKCFEASRCSWVLSVWLFSSGSLGAG